MRPTGMALAVVLAFTSVDGTVGAAEPSVAPDAALRRLEKDIFYLAGDECEGRGTETKGILKAGQYVADAFKAAGLKPAGTDGYFQPFAINGPAKLGSPNTLRFAGPDGVKIDLKYGAEFTPTGLSAAGKVAGGVVFVGYGVRAPKLNYDDYAGVDVAGKVVVVLRRTPKADDKDNVFEKDVAAQHAALVTKIAAATAAKATAIVFVNDATYAKTGDPLMDFRYAGQAGTLPAVHVKREVVDRLLAGRGKKLADIEAAIEKGLKPRSIDLDGWAAAGEVTVTRGKLPARNVVAVAEGAGPLAGETVVVGAHYDHLGYGETGSLGGKDGKGKLHYGADDNGSGTTGLMELARRIGGRADRQGRRIVFVAFAGEERGLFGSIHYCKEPPFPLASTVFMLNMDMIGRVVAVEDKPAGKVDKREEKGPVVKKDRIVIYGTGTAEGLDEVVDATNEKFGFKVLKIPGGTGPSDHDSFYRKKIPVLFFFTGTHKDYHRPSDTPDKVNLAGLNKVVGFAEVCINHYAAAPARPKYLATKGGWEDPTEERPNRTGRPAAMPRLGFMPGDYSGTDGVLVGGVSPGGAAEKGGVKEDDIIVSVAGKPVTDMTSYMTVMAGQKPGVEIEIVVRRKDKKVTLKATPQP